MLEKAKNQLYALGFVAIIFLICTLIIVLGIDPDKAGSIIYLALYLSIGLFSLSFFTLVTYGLRSRFVDDLHYRKVNTAFRESFLLSILIVGFLLLSSMDILYWWIAVIFILTLIFIELFYLTK